MVAVVGPMMSTGVKFTQPYCAGFNIPQLAPVATDPTFSFTPANFPFLVRLSPSDNMQCQALGGLISHYNWTQIALLTSKDDYGLYSFICLLSISFFTFFRLVPFYSRQRRQVTALNRSHISTESASSMVKGGLGEKQNLFL